MNLTIRAHHLLCTTEFSGHGYSGGFAAHMEQVVRILHSGENHRITLIISPDLICAACPNLSEGRCRENNNHVVRKDQDVLASFHLEKNHPYLFSELLEALIQKMDADLFEKLCGSCDWRVQGLCSPESMTEKAQIFLKRIRCGADEKSITKDTDNCGGSLRNGR